MPTKFLALGGRFGFFGGGRSADFSFYGRGDFSDLLNPAEIQRFSLGSDAKFVRATGVCTTPVIEIPPSETHDNMPYKKIMSAYPVYGNPQTGPLRQAKSRRALTFL